MASPKISGGATLPVPPRDTAVPVAPPEPAAAEPARGVRRTRSNSATGAATPSSPPPPKAKDTDSDGFLVGRDGKLFPPGASLGSIPAVQPNNGTPPSGRAILVNGIMTDHALQARDMQALANTGVEVVGIHNATQGLVADLIQCVTDKASIGKNPAVDTVSSELYSALKEERPLHLVGHSQGALIISRALQETRNRLLVEDRMPPAEVEERLGKIQVETYGGAASSYVDGPAYTHYVNKYDVVPMLTGIGPDKNPFSHPGKGAVLHYFGEANKPHDMPSLSEGLSNFFARLVDRSTHGPQDVYFKRRDGGGQ